MPARITDAEVLEFIARTERASPPLHGQRNIAAERQAYNRLAAIFQAPRPAGLALEDMVYKGPGGLIPARRYWPPRPHGPRLLYFHGGGYVLGGVETHDSICAEIAVRCGCELVSATYRLAPEHRHPSAYEDALAALESFGDRPIVVIGDSAGGNLAAAVAATGHRQLIGQVLIYPDLGGLRMNLPSYTERATAPLLSSEDIASYGHLRAGGPPPADDPSFSPLAKASLSGAPPCFISVAEHDPLRDDGPAYVLKLTEAGIAAEVVVEPELPHGHLRARHMSARAAQAFDRICDAISRLAGTAAAS